MARAKTRNSSGAAATPKVRISEELLSALDEEVAHSWPDARINRTQAVGIAVADWVKHRKKIRKRSTT